MTESSSTTLERTDMITPAEAANELMAAFDQPIRTTPTADIPDNERLLRARLVYEEAAEFVEAMGCIVAQGVGTEPIVTDIGGEVDLVEAADAIADIIVVTYGAANSLGVPADAVHEIVHETNMAKLAGPIREDGKRLKPEGWEPPTERIRELLFPTQFPTPMCSMCRRARQPLNPEFPMDAYDYSAFQVMNGQPLGWYSGDDGEVCPEDMTVTISGQFAGRHVGHGHD